MTTLLPPPTLAEVVAELRHRIAANRKTVEQAQRDKLKVQEMVCQRTAMELERFVFWITGSK
jgi:hypothetical protein